MPVSEQNSYIVFNCCNQTNISCCWILLECFLFFCFFLNSGLTIQTPAILISKCHCQYKNTAISNQVATFCFCNRNLLAVPTLFYASTLQVDKWNMKWVNQQLLEALDRINEISNHLCNISGWEKIVQLKLSIVNFLDNTQPNLEIQIKEKTVS